MSSAINNTKINCYQVDETMVKTLAPLLIKVLADQKKALIYCQDDQQIHELDKNLWSYGRSRFIPHITIFDQDFDIARQPILLTNNLANDNQAEFLFFFAPVQQNFINNFTKAFYLYQGELVNSNLKIDNHFKKINQKWVNVNL
jgi:DNA polymerase IIIc chi subunit